MSQLDHLSSKKMQAWKAFWLQIEQHLVAHAIHPAQAVVLLPFVQLLPWARQTAQECWGQTFLPRIETTQTWCTRIAHFMPDALDLSFDAGQDDLRARAWLSKANLTAQQSVFSPLLLQTTYKMAQAASAIAPKRRAAWAEKMRELVVFSNDGVDQYEAALIRIALEWAAASAYASDVLFDEVSNPHQALIVVQGVQKNALTQALLREAGERGNSLTLPESPLGQAQLHICANEEDEALRAAACVVAHLEAQLGPVGGLVGIAALDRSASRRISALLAQRGIAVKDETGWKISTTRSAANLMSLLRAAKATATLDEQLDWLKHTGIRAEKIQAWEASLRQQNSDLAQAEKAQAAIKFEVNGALVSFSELLKKLQISRTFSQWQTHVRELLKITGQWDNLQNDDAGAQLLSALALQTNPSEPTAELDLKMSLADYGDWLQNCLESVNFKPALNSDAGTSQVLLTPLAQLAARPFAALVIAGADEKNLPLSGRSIDLLGPAQIKALGLPDREQKAVEQREAWRWAMQVPNIDILYKTSQAGEALLKSPVLAAWQLAHPLQMAIEPRILKAIPKISHTESAGTATDLIATNEPLMFTASSYADLRACPYRYFALRLLGLQEFKELDANLSKRDFGTWLHEVLQRFHETRDDSFNAEIDREQLEKIAAQISQEHFAQDAGFMPFAAAWPQVREAYLTWLQKHQDQAWQFSRGELKREIRLGDAVLLRGRLDRVDVQTMENQRQNYVIDYKTESMGSLRERVTEPLEDTQLLFYAALLGDVPADALRAAYLGLSEKDVSLIEQKQLQIALPIFQQGIELDALQLQEGKSLPAHGEGKVCETCAARGLCRRDFREVGA